MIEKGVERDKDFILVQIIRLDHKFDIQLDIVLGDISPNAIVKAFPEFFVHILFAYIVFIIGEKLEAFV